MVVSKKKKVITLLSDGKCIYKDCQRLFSHCFHVQIFVRKPNCSKFGTFENRERIARGAPRFLSRSAGTPMEHFEKLCFVDAFSVRQEGDDLFFLETTMSLLWGSISNGVPIHGLLITKS